MPFTYHREKAGSGEPIKIWLALALLAFAMPAAAGPAREPRFLAGEAPRPWLGREIGGAMTDVFHPAYRLVEGVSDGVYNFMRSHLIGTLLPDRLTRSLRRSPSGDSCALFDEQLGRKEYRYLERLRDSYPTSDGSAGGRYSPDRSAEWRSWAASEQVSVVIDSFRETLLERYQLEVFGRSSGRYAKDRRNWDPGFLTMAGILGGTFVYLNGLHTDAHLGKMRLGIDLRAGMKIREDLQSGAGTRRLAGLELGYKDKPLTLATEWGTERGNLRNERFGLKYRLSY